MKKNILILNTVIGAMLVAVVGLGFVTEPTVLSAATSGGGKIINPLGSTTTFSQVLTIVISTVQVIAGILSVVYIILAGLSFVMANGDPAKITKARTMLLYVVIGVAIIFGAQAISIVVQTTIKQVGSGQ